MGYLWPLSDAFADQFMARFGHCFPTTIDTSAPVQSSISQLPPPPPAEALLGADDLVRRLIGVTRHTLSGAENRIIGVSRDNVTVATHKSPEGQHVPISEVQSALDKLIATGSIIINPENFGYRSAFVGTVLQTIPGVHAERTAKRYRLSLVSPEAAAPGDAGNCRGHRDVRRRPVYSEAPLKPVESRLCCAGVCSAPPLRPPARYVRGRVPDALLGGRARQEARDMLPVRSVRDHRAPCGHGCVRIRV